MVKAKKNKGKGKEILLNLLIFCVMLIVVFFVIEMGARVLFPSSLSDKMYHREFIYKNIPNKEVYVNNPEFGEYNIKYNSLGYNDKERDVTKADDVYRIIVIGDSLVEGEGVRPELHFTRLLESKLQADYPDKKVEVMAMGVTSYATENEIVVLEKHALRYNPDLVVLQFSWNDYYDNCKRDIFLYEDSKLVKNYPLPMDYLRSLRYFLTSRSYLAYEGWKLVSRGVLTGKGDGDLLFYGTPKQFFINGPDEFLDNCEAETNAQLDYFEDLAHKNGIETLYFVCPIKEQVSQRILENYPEYFSEEDISNFNNTKYPDEFADYMNLKGMNYVDMAHKFIELDSGNSFYHTIDMHWNNAGHELATEILYDWIKDNVEIE